MKDFLITLIDKKVICENTILFTFNTKDTGYYFEAGQYAHFTITNPVSEDEKGHSRPLSIASSPNNKDTITIAARKGSSVFINNLSQLSPGSKVLVSEPSGNLTLVNDINLTKVFISGGTGITPVRSIIEKVIQDRSLHQIYLFYSNKKESQVSFMKDFEEWSILNKNFKFIAVIEDSENKSWKYEYGKVNKDLLKKYLNDLKNKIYYLTGPPLMVDSLREILLAEGISDGFIKSEKFI